PLFLSPWHSPIRLTQLSPAGGRLQLQTCHICFMASLTVLLSHEAFSLTHTHTRTHARTHTDPHAHAHTHTRRHTRTCNLSPYCRQSPSSKMRNGFSVRKPI